MESVIQSASQSVKSVNVPHPHGPTSHSSHVISTD